MTYADNAFEYFKKGYSPLWLPERQKEPPPTGYTGVTGLWASGADIQEWVEAHPNGNTALRLPSNVIVLDVDNYGKAAAKTMTAAIEDLGPLPVIGRSSGRPDDPISGHRLFRLPDDKAGTRFVKDLDTVGYGPGVDIIQSTHRYIVAPGSIHPDGGVYTWYGTPGQVDFPAVADLPELPAAWIEKLTKKTVDREEIPDSTMYDEMPPERQAKIDNWCRKILGEIYEDLDAMKTWPMKAGGEIRVGGGRKLHVAGWESGIFRLTGDAATIVKASWNNLDPAEIARELRKHLPHDSGLPLDDGLSKFTRGVLNNDHEAMAPREEPDLEDDDFEWWDDWEPMRTLTPAETAQVDPPEAWPKRSMTGLGNVERALEHVAGKLIYVDGLGWLEYRDGIWARGKSPDDDDVAAGWVDRAWKQALEHETEKYDDTDEVGSNGKVKEGSSPRAKFRHWLSDQFSSSKKKSTAAQMRQNARDYELAVDSGRLDIEDFDLAVRNGVVDLRTGELRDARPLDFITKKSDVVYEPEAKAPTFERYLETSIPDPEIRDYLQKIVGYSMTNSTLEQVFFIHYGPKSSNGKSVLINMMEKILGDHFSPASSKALLTSKNDKVGQDYVDLVGPRFLALSETRQGDSLDESAVKSLTAGDWRADRAHYSGNQKYRVTGKMHIVTNALPHVNPDEAMRRRLHLVPWEVSFAGGKGDPMLEEKLARELPGILAWAVRGAMLWHKQFRTTGSGLEKPLTAVAATERYLFDEDEVARWRAESTIEVDQDTPGTAWTPAQELYDNYRAWHSTQGSSNPMSQQAFLRRLGKTGTIASKNVKVDGRQGKRWPLRLEKRSSVIDDW